MNEYHELILSLAKRVKELKKELKVKDKTIEELQIKINDLRSQLDNVTEKYLDNIYSGNLRRHIKP